MDAEILVLIYGLVSLATLVGFFMIVINVAAIKTKMNKGSDWWDKYLKHKFYGENELALVALREYMWDKMKRARESGLTDVEKKQWEENYKKEYGPLFEELGSQYPDGLMFVIKMV